MKRIKCIISYDGTHFAGYQVQPNKRTVQGELEQTLAKMHKGEMVRVVASGRTDAGVHAYGQVIHFDSSLLLPAERWQKALNALLPDDIVVRDVQEVDFSFHARFSATAKEYRYKIRTAEEQDVFSRYYCYHYPYALDIEAIKHALNAVKGTHDFTSFCSAKTEIEDRVRTIYEAEAISSHNGLEFRFVGNGFLYNMVRILVGTILEIGQGKREADCIPSILQGKDRRLAGKTAPPHGLYLWNVYYDN
ncbi:tRNA pseudouridine(38-40) synthase TruA [Thermaerobacillus caldiproteolyticus]|uniref:tRNA pseudouridine(38-40) synthase TruA n=1 Tax=Thermaerobacillus caldiproteolyticus TaxID=247480 RepID=UPI00188BEC2C|nr:tRNA pseudouridine(38-40) synthase TruA [Anoxybacillus caldiproteolyticus]QPA31090.1 tRNA pseudouridine(38-40) synthase TruA [Anoxybacillus caldiproteolyticus]